MLNLTKLIWNICYQWSKKKGGKKSEFWGYFLKYVGKIHLLQLAQLSQHYISYPRTEYYVSHVSIFAATAGADVWFREKPKRKAKISLGIPKIVHNVLHTWTKEKTVFKRWTCLSQSSKNASFFFYVANTNCAKIFQCTQNGWTGKSLRKCWFRRGFPYTSKLLCNYTGWIHISREKRARKGQESERKSRWTTTSNHTEANSFLHGQQ